jgi:hypothetical protein
MAVFVSNLTIYTGTDFKQTFSLEDPNSNSALNLSGYSGCAKLKRYETSGITTTFTVSFPLNQMGNVVVSLGSTDTLNLKPGKYFYDLVLESPDTTVTRVIEGQVLVKQSVTRL